MLHGLVPAALQNIERANDVAVHVGMRCLDRVAHARLRPQVHDALEFLARKALRHAGGIGKVELDEAKARILLQQLQARHLQIDVVVLVEIIEADYLITALEQAPGGVKADEARGSGDENLHRRPSTSAAGKTCLMS